MWAYSILVILILGLTGHFIGVHFVCFTACTFVTYILNISNIKKRQDFLKTFIVSKNAFNHLPLETYSYTPLSWKSYLYVNHGNNWYIRMFTEINFMRLKCDKNSQVAVRNGPIGRHRDRKEAKVANSKLSNKLQLKRSWSVKTRQKY